MYERDTIAAIATPPGQGGVAIIRLSGPQAEAIACRIVVLTRPPAQLVSHHLYVGRIIDPLTNQPLDQGLLVLMHAPHSYTGEDVAEIHCHGGSFLSRRILAAVLGQGTRMAAAGEFTKRAFLNGRLDLSQAEAVLDLIQAQHSAGLQLAWEQLSGRLSVMCTALREKLLALTAYLEAFLDFPDDDIPERNRAELEQDLARVSAEIAAVGATFARGKVYREGLRTAIVGKPNVGKSSVLNLLTGTDRAIVTAVPGTTRDILEETVVIKDVPLVVWDMAGLRQTVDEVERIGVERARAGMKAAELVLAVFDASRTLADEDITICDELTEKRVVPILNKVDLPIVADITALEDHLHAGPFVRLCATSGAGLAELEARIHAVAVGTMSASAQEQIPEVTITHVRHRDALVKAEGSLRQASAGLQASVPLDLVAVDLRAALDHIGEITGHITSEDILDWVFREFCIGK